MRAEIFAGENYFGPNSALVAIDERIGAEELSLTADFRHRIRAGIHVLYVLLAVANTV